MVEKPQGNTEPTESAQGETEDAPQFVTIKQHNEQLNKALTAYKKQWEAKLDSKLEQLLASKQPQPESTQVDPTAAESKPARDPEKVAMQKQLAALLEREKEREKRLTEQSLANTLRDGFIAKGVDPKYVDHASAYFRAKHGVKIDETGAVKAQIDDIDYDINDALSVWIKTDEAKLYLPARGTSGSGSQPIKSGNQQAKAGMSPADLGLLLLTELNNT